MKPAKSTAAGAPPVELTTEYLVNPLGVETTAPRLSWMLESSRRGRKQTGYQILAASSAELLAADKGDLWNSGRVRSDESVLVAYDGKPLCSRQKCFWKVRVWFAPSKAERAADDKPTRYSQAASWEMGLLRQTDWQGRWIAASADVTPMPPEAGPAPMLRKTFRLDKPVASARAYICGLGYFELHVNGRKVGQNALEPGFTRYDARTLYLTYDITGHLQVGLNAAGVILGTGWYNLHTRDAWNFEAAPWRDRPKLIAQIHVRFADGTEDVIVSDTSWKGTFAGPIVFDGLRNGETYDARREKPGWATADFHDTDWKPAMRIPCPGGRLVSQQHTPIRVVDTIRPVALAQPKPGVWVFDLGRSIAGWAQLRVYGPEGAQVTMRYAERLAEDGDVDQGNIRPFIRTGDCQTDRYILKGRGTEVWEPRFTYHGFRWVQVTGLPHAPTLDSLRGREVHTAFAQRGRFECSNDLLNRIQECALAATLSNYHGIPTDCPHREKNGWTGDAQLSAEQVLYNFDPMTAYAKWMNDCADAQRDSGQLPGIIPTGGWGYNWGSGPAWDSAYVNIPWYLWLYCRDAKVLADHYDGMKRYLDFMTSMADGHILEFGLGDWCAPGEGFGKARCPTAVTSTGYYYANARTLWRIAAVLGKTTDAKKYSRLAEQIRDAFLARFYDEPTGQIAGGSQTAQGCGLFMGLVPADQRGKVADALIAEIASCKGHLDFGILGAKYVLNALTDCDRAEAAYALVARDDYPGWGHWIRQGATTLWETWEGAASRNHHMFSDVSAWFYKTLAGINLDPDSPGFKHVILRPHPVADLTWVRAEHRSMYGPIRVAWTRAEGKFTLRIHLPPNTTATIHVPAGDPASVTEGGKCVPKVKDVEFVGTDAGRAVFNVGAGDYEFVSSL